MQSIIKPIVRGIYDIQKLRIEMGNRIVANFKSKLGQGPSEPESNIEVVGKIILERLRREYKCIADGVAKISAKNFKGNEIISSYAEFALIGQYVKLVVAEEQNLKELGTILRLFQFTKSFCLMSKGSARPWQV